MQVTLALLADYANVTAEGKLNILGIFDRITVQELPAVHTQMHLVLRLEAAAADQNRSHNVEIRLQDPEGRSVLDVRGDLVPHSVPGRTSATNQILTFNNVQLNRAGSHAFVVRVDGAIRAEVPLGVEVAPSGPAN
jgi:hypothetical protein